MPLLATPFLPHLAGTDFVAISIIVILSEGLDPLADRAPQSKDPTPVCGGTILAGSSHQASLRALAYSLRSLRLKLHACVLTPDHVHLLLTPAQDITLERVMQLIKGGYSHNFGSQFGRKKEVWQRGFTVTIVFATLTILQRIESTSIGIR